MKKNILIQVGTRTEQRTVTSYNDDGNEVSEVIEVEVPVMESVYVDMTPEEIAQLPQEEPQEEPTPEELAEEAYLKAEYNSILLEMMMEE